jgi:metal-responsive CopG/Arc/MetJ family transcriptional regulator
MSEIKKDKDGKLRYEVDDLVKIGDAIHGSFASFVIAANDPQKDKDANITTAIHGHEDEVIEMLKIVFDENPVMRHIVVSALHRLRTEILHKKLVKNLSEQDEDE